MFSGDYYCTQCFSGSSGRQWKLERKIKYLFDLQIDLFCLAKFDFYRLASVDII